LDVLPGKRLGCRENSTERDAVALLREVEVQHVAAGRAIVGTRREGSR
jgi:hypothetical protein